MCVNAGHAAAKEHLGFPSSHSLLHLPFFFSYSICGILLPRPKSFSHFRLMHVGRLRAIVPCRAGRFMKTPPAVTPKPLFVRWYDFQRPWAPNSTHMGSSTFPKRLLHGHLDVRVRFLANDVTKRSPETPASVYNIPHAGRGWVHLKKDWQISRELICSQLFAPFVLFLIFRCVTVTLLWEHLFDV